MTYEPTGFALQIFQSRHAAHSKETWLEACDRVSRHVSNAEAGDARTTWRDKFYSALSNNLFMPGGRIWYGAGRARGQMLNCFVIGTADSREGWGKTVSDSIVISGTGGGVGLNCSPIRPRGSSINGTGGEATGAVSLMEIINATGEVIKAGGGRRTALMLCLSLSHGDVVEFLDKKLDLKQLNNANISVVFDEDPDVFFRLVREDGEWPLMHQGRQVGLIPAKQLWERIVMNALAGGEPGALNRFQANKMSNIWYIEDLTSTNPCFAPDTRISTDKGMIRIEDLAKLGRSAAVVADRRVGKGDRLTANFGTSVLPAVDVELKQRNAPVYKVTTEHGYTVTATEEHLFITTSGRKQLKNLLYGDTLMLPSGEGGFGAKGSYEQGLVLGMYVGDGTSTPTEAFVDMWGEDRDQCDVVGGAVHSVIADVPANNGQTYNPLVWMKQGDDKVRMGGLRLRRWLTSIANNENFSSLKQRVPESVWQGSRDFVRGYLHGLFFSDGTLNVVGHQTKQTVSWRLSQANKPLLEDIQRLLTNFGVVSRIYSRQPAGYRSLPDGHGGHADYLCRATFELVINRPNLINYRERIGMFGRKADAIDVALTARGTDCQKPERYISRIVAIEPAGVVDVYCLTQPETNCVVSDGIVNGQCGEIWMSPYDCCCLGALVLPRFVVGGEVDWKMLEDTVRTGVRFLDNVLTVNEYPLPEIKAKCSQLRRIGLGITGLHHMLLELGLKYNSPEGLEFVDNLMKKIKNWSYEASSDLAIEKGSFPGFDADKFLKGTFIKNLKPSLRTKIRRGMRNCATMTIAPVGTGSIVCDVSSGIEPIFAPAHVRKFQKGTNADGTKNFGTEDLVDPMFQRFVLEGRDVTHFVGAYDLSMRDHLEMQRVCQRHVDNAVSKTINVPPDTSPTELGDLMMEFFPDLKGLTVYPDGSREDQPLTPIPLERALTLAKTSLAEATSQDACRSGVCDV